MLKSLRKMVDGNRYGLVTIILCACAVFAWLACAWFAFACPVYAAENSLSQGDKVANAAQKDTVVRKLTVRYSSTGKLYKWGAGEQELWLTWSELFDATSPSLVTIHLLSATSGKEIDEPIKKLVYPGYYNEITAPKYDDYPVVHGMVFENTGMYSKTNDTIAFNAWYNDVEAVFYYGDSVEEVKQAIDDAMQSGDLPVFEKPGTHNHSEVDSFIYIMAVDCDTNEIVSQHKWLVPCSYCYTAHMPSLPSGYKYVDSSCIFAYADAPEETLRFTNIDGQRPHAFTPYIGRMGCGHNVIIKYLCHKVEDIGA